MITLITQPTSILEIDNYNSEPESHANQSSDDGDFSNRSLVDNLEICVITSDVFEDLNVKSEPKTILSQLPSCKKVSI